MEYSPIEDHTFCHEFVEHGGCDEKNQVGQELDDDITVKTDVFADVKRGAKNVQHPLHAGHSTRTVGVSRGAARWLEDLPHWSKQHL